MLDLYKTKRKRADRPGRLKGKALEALRRACFERDGFLCQHLRVVGSINVFGVPTDTWGKCRHSVTWETGHMHHIKTRGAGGRDDLSNVTTLCPDCHHRLHSIEGTQKGRRI